MSRAPPPPNASELILLPSLRRHSDSFRTYWAQIPHSQEHTRIHPVMSGKWPFGIRYRFPCDCSAISVLATSSYTGFSCLLQVQILDPASQSQPPCFWLFYFHYSCPSYNPAIQRRSRTPHSSRKKFYMSTTLNTSDPGPNPSTETWARNSANRLLTVPLVMNNTTRSKCLPQW